MKFIRLSALLPAAVLMLGCAWQPRSVQPQEPAASQETNLPALAELLPPLPDPRAASFAFVSEIDGSETLDRSVNAVDNGTALDVLSASNAISYGIWQFTPALQRPASVQAVMSIQPGNVAYLALADYRSGCWEIKGPYSAGIVLPLDEERHKSSGGNFCVAVICATGDSVTVHKLVLTANYEWQVVTVDSVGNVGRYTSLAVVDGNPAISYCEHSWEGVADAAKYIRAADALGEGWSVPFVLSNEFDAYSYTSLEVVHGHPAVSYCTLLDVVPLGGGALWYKRATNPAGSAWATAVHLDDGYLMQHYDVGKFNSLALVDGRPAVSYYSSSYQLAYRKALDADGAAWGARQVADTGEDGFGFQYTSLVDDMGLPLICYYDVASASLKVVGSNAEQTAFNTPIAIDAVLGEDTGAYASAALISGVAAVAYYNDKIMTGGRLKYAVYNLLAGEWQSVVVTNYGNPGQHCSLASIAGVPAISYYDAAGGDLMYVQALDATGQSWSAPETVDSVGNVGTYTSLAEVDGKPAISYYDEDQRDLKYAIRRGP